MGHANQPLAMARWKVFRFLDAYGGEIADASGRATSLMSVPLGYKSPRSLMSLLAKLDDEGLVKRQMHPNGRRTYRIWLTDAGKAAAGKVPSSVPIYRPRAGGGVFVRPADIPLDVDDAPALTIEAPADDAPADDAPADEAPAVAGPPLVFDTMPTVGTFDLGGLRVDTSPVFTTAPDVSALASALLALVIDKATAGPPAVEVERVRRDIEEARRRLADTLDDNARLRRRLDIAQDELAARRQETGSLRSRIAMLESNLAAAIKAAADGVVIDERRLRELDRLIREVPRSPVVKAG